MIPGIIVQTVSNIWCSNKYRLEILLNIKDNII